MIIDITKATSNQINYLVAQIERHEYRYPWMLEKDGYAAWQGSERGWGNPTPAYTTDWDVGGPLMEKHGIWCRLLLPEYWVARTDDEEYWDEGVAGTSYLDAAMRRYCVQSFGGWMVDIPEGVK